MLTTKRLGTGSYRVTLGDRTIDVALLPNRWQWTIVNNCGITKVGPYNSLKEVKQALEAFKPVPTHLLVQRPRCAAGLPADAAQALLDGREAAAALRVRYLQFEPEDRAVVEALQIDYFDAGYGANTDFPMSACWVLAMHEVLKTWTPPLRKTF